MSQVLRTGSKKIAGSFMAMICVLAVAIGSSAPASAGTTTQLVDYGAQWSHGSYLAWNGKVAFSNLFSQKHAHSCTATISGNTAYDSKPGGKESRASIAGYVWDTAYATYNVD